VFHDSPVLVGRGAECNLAFTEGEISQRISERHAEFSLRPDGLFVRDLNSTNGVYVNDEEVGECRLEVGDCVGLGRRGPRLEVLEFGLPQAEESAPQRRPLEYAAPQQPRDDVQMPDRPVLAEVHDEAGAPERALSVPENRQLAVSAPAAHESGQLGTTRRMLHSAIGQNRKMWTKAAFVAGGVVVLMLVLGVVWVTSRPTKPEKTVYPRLLRSTVLIADSWGNPRGTGALVDEDRQLVITNYHVVAEYDEQRTLVGEIDEVLIFWPKYYEGKLVTDKRDYEPAFADLSGIRGRVLCSDPRRDLAVIEVEELWEDARALKIADQQAKPGQRVHSVGNPATSGAVWVYSAGTVRAAYHHKWRAEGLDFESDVVETESLLNPGDSGGPLVNDAGELLGVAHGSMHSLGGRLGSFFIDAGEVRWILSVRT